MQANIYENAAPVKNEWTGIDGRLLGEVICLHSVRPRAFYATPVSPPQGARDRRKHLFALSGA